MIKIRYILQLIICLLVITACSSGNDSPGKKIDSFSFTDQNELSFGLDDLTGKIWIANFIFTNCETVCPPMMSEMASLQRLVDEENIQVEFVSFTVDPEIDSSEILKQYIQQFSDNETNWHMLTGYSQEDIEVFAREQFQTIVQKPSTSNQVIHGTNFYLVNDQGYILNEYNYIDDSYVDEMIRDIKKIR